MLVVVDDDLFYQNQVATCLEDRFEVSCFPTTEISQDILKRAEALVLDLCLPESDAILFLEALQPCAHRIQLLIISGANTKTIESAVKLATMYGFKSVSSLAKPFSCPDLNQLVKTLDENGSRSARVESENIKPSLIFLEEFSNALGSGQFICHFQPQVSLGSDQLWGIEALARWQHPTRGLLSPYYFIAHADSTEVASKFFCEILDGALQCLNVVWNETGMRVPVSVNISPAAFVDIDLPGKIAALLVEHGIAASSLTLEITERGASEYDSVSFSAISRLRILGITLAMDDFGAGDSGLRKLKSFGYDEIKIDKSLVDNLLVSEESQMILKSIVGMSANLGLVVVIEGIESVDQLFWLKNEYQKSDLIIQGYCYSKPLDVVSLVNAMKTGFGIGDTSQGSQQLLAHQSPALALPCAPL